MTLAEIRQAILARYPIGSEWYDCAQDHCGAVALHFEPFGLLLDCGELGLVQYGYNGLVTGRLIEPRIGGYFNQYRAERDAAKDQFWAALQKAGLADKSIWS